MYTSDEKDLPQALSYRYRPRQFALDGITTPGTYVCVLGTQWKAIIQHLTEL